MEREGVESVHLANLFWPQPPAVGATVSGSLAALSSRYSQASC